MDKPFSVASAATPATENQPKRSSRLCGQPETSHF